LPVVVGAARCCECGETPADAYLSDHGPLCDGCMDARMSALMGMPRLPASPDLVVISDLGGGRHRMRYRFWRAPTGVVVELREDDAVGEGYEFGVFGDHDAEVEVLVTAVTVEAKREIGRRYLEPGLGGWGWSVAGDDVAGRFVWDPEGGPPRVVIDGHPLSWEEFGEALGSFEGWRFRMVIEERAVDVRSAPRLLDVDDEGPAP
jgi:hypothetical protein